MAGFTCLNRFISMQDDKIRRSGLDIVGNVPWGTHLCQFYQTKEDLINILVPYFKTGLENNEFCMWVTSEPLSVKEALEAMRMRSALPDFDRYLEKGQIEIIPYSEWYLKDGAFNLRRVLNAWLNKLNRALEKKYDGMRVADNTAWLEKKNWKGFIDHEEAIDNAIGKYRMIAICSYSLEKCDASEVIDVIKNHQFALIAREGRWTLVESSERKRTKEIVKESEERYETLVENAGDCIYFLNAKGHVVHTNKRALVLNEIDDQNFILGKQFSDIVVPRYKEIVIGYIRKSLLGITSQFHYETVTPKKHHKWWEATLIPLRNGKGDVINMLSISRDLTAERESKAKVGFYKEYADNILASVPISILVVNRSEHIIFVNKNFLTKMKMERMSVIGMKLSEVMPSDIMKVTEWQKQIKEVIKTRDLISGQKFEYNGKNFIYHMVPMREAIGKRYNVAIMMEDVTDRVLLEKQLQHSERLVMMGQFAAGVTHEINNPLAIIKGNVQYLREQIKKGVDFRKKVDFRELKGTLTTVEEEAIRCADIVSNLLHFARKGDNKRKSNVDVNHVVRHVIHIMGRQLSLKNIKLVKELAPHVNPIRGNHELLQQAVMNLVLNAEQAIARRGIITIKTLQNRRYVYIVVKDTGCGIANELLRFVFDPFFTTKGNSGGTGLGLSVVHTIVEDHGGTISVKSVPKRGSTFTITLPAGK